MYLRARAAAQRVDGIDRLSVMRNCQKDEETELALKSRLDLHMEPVKFLTWCCPLTVPFGPKVLVQCAVL